MSARSDLRHVIRDCVRAGLVLQHGGRHPRLVDPRSGRFVVIAGTPSCPHAYKNVLADVRRYLHVSV